MKRHLAFDSSSTTIGWSVFENGRRTRSGTHHLVDKDIAVRCEGAHQFVQTMLTWQVPDLVVLESPVGRFAKAVVPQARVSGAILAAISETGVRYIEVAPTEAKKALAGKGTADKVEMLAAAAPYLGYEADKLVFRKKNGLWRAYLNEKEVYDENESDAVGVGVAGMRRAVS